MGGNKSNAVYCNINIEFGNILNDHFSVQTKNTFKLQ